MNGSPNPAGDQKNADAELGAPASPPASLSSVRARALKARAAELGFTMTGTDQSRIYNTFDAHRLLHWAGLQSPAAQAALKHALFTAYFTDGANPSAPDVLAAAVQAAGLDLAQAKDVIASGRYAEEVRAAEHHWRTNGISAVPAVIVNDRYLISGGQSPEAFERALRTIVAETAGT